MPYAPVSVLNEIIDARAAATQYPRIPKYTPKDDVLEKIGWNARTLRRKVREGKWQIKSVLAKGKDGNPVYRVYLPNRFLQSCGFEALIDDRTITEEPKRNSKRATLPEDGGDAHSATATPVLSGVSQDYLDALYDWKCFSPAQRAGAEEVAQKLQRNAGYIGHIAAKLNKQGLVDSSMGSGAGSWLTDTGKATVEHTRR
jgi:hypothetical protein